MLERTYSRYIGDHSDALARHALLFRRLVARQGFTMCKQDDDRPGFQGELNSALVAEPIRYVVHHRADGAGRKPSPDHAEEQHRVRALHDVNVDEMGHDLNCCRVRTRI